MLAFGGMSSVAPRHRRRNGDRLLFRLRSFARSVVASANSAVRRLEK